MMYVFSDVFIEFLLIKHTAAVHNHQKSISSYIIAILSQLLKNIFKNDISDS